MTPREESAVRFLFDSDLDPDLYPDLSSSLFSFVSATTTAAVQPKPSAHD